jgi:hypothetical protein
MLPRSVTPGLPLLTVQTAFHASFSDYDLADEQSLKISRGTSVVSRPGPLIESQN